MEKERKNKFYGFPPFELRVWGRPSGGITIVYKIFDELYIRMGANVYYLHGLVHRH